MNPTVVLVHGAYAEASSWSDVVRPLIDEGHRVIAWAAPLRGPASDAAALTDLVRSIEGPVVLVGHSFGGALSSNVPADAGDITALVFVAGYALLPGESCGDASSLAPGGTLGPTLVRVPLSDGGVDTYIDPAEYPHQFAEDLPQEQTALMAVTQATGDRGGPVRAVGRPAAVAHGARLVRLRGAGPQHPGRCAPHHGRAGGSRRTLEITGASHVVGMSHPTETLEMILEAVRAGAPVGAEQ
jgi:pimeloyl-ACP methyl ester carboxylesterase